MAFHQRRPTLRYVLYTRENTLVVDRSPQFITDADTTMDLISRSVVPGAYMADLFPACESIGRPK